MSRKMTSLLALAVSAILLLGMAPALAEPAPRLVDEPTTLKFAVRKSSAHGDFNEMPFVLKYEEQTGVHIEWEQIPSENYTEKKNLILASGDLPDAFFGEGLTDYDVMLYGQQGYLLPLDDLIEEHAPNIRAVFEKMPEARAASTMPDGHIYSLPYIEEMGIIYVQTIFYMNQTWLDNLGLEIPDTMDAYIEVLRAFRDNDANGNGDAGDEIPLTGVYANEQQGLFNLFSAFGRPDNPMHIVVEDKEAVFTADKPEYRAAVETFHQMYQEKLIDPEFFTQNFNQMIAKGQSEDNVIGSMIVWRDFQVVGGQRAADDFVAIEPLINSNGVRLWGRSNNSDVRKHAFSLTKDCVDPVLAIQWVDGLFDTMTSIEMNWGTFGDVQVLNDQGLYVTDYSKAAEEQGITANEVRFHNTPGGGTPCAIFGDAYGTIIQMETGGAGRKVILDTLYAQYVPSESYPSLINYTEEQLDAINNYANEINTYVNDTTAKWIVEGGIEAEWDAFVAQLNAMGLADYMQVRQEALDTYLSSAE